mmetsp:Transcript_48462/g.140367  ORF Transcript_48462/g.140367 Transcript_48462/m.140367 type:complete len:292 (-) Transcript_48462:414-1289(-)
MGALTAEGVPSSGRHGPQPQDAHCVQHVVRQVQRRGHIRKLLGEAGQPPNVHKAGQVRSLLLDEAKGQARLRHLLGEEVQAPGQVRHLRKDGDPPCLLALRSGKRRGRHVEGSRRQQRGGVKAHELAPRQGLANRRQVGAQGCHAVHIQHLPELQGLLVADLELALGGSLQPRAAEGVLQACGEEFFELAPPQSWALVGRVQHLHGARFAPGHIAPVQPNKAVAPVQNRHVVGTELAPVHRNKVFTDGTGLRKGFQEGLLLVAKGRQLRAASTQEGVRGVTLRGDFIQGRH